VLLDHRQNGWGKTIASVYSVRPKPGAPVSTPLRWKELKPGLRPTDFPLRVALKRLERHGDLYAPVLEEPRALGASAKRLARLH
jgi:bifunctional non-homologous end joining protein LigD